MKTIKRRIKGHAETTKKNEYIFCSVGAERAIFTPTNHNMTNQLLLTYKIHSPTPEYTTPLLE
jgi:hypothetical protein